VELGFHRGLGGFETRIIPLALACGASRAAR
jgi:hypothetical protein